MQSCPDSPLIKIFSERPTIESGTQELCRGNCWSQAQTCSLSSSLRKEAEPRECNEKLVREYINNVRNKYTQATLVANKKETGKYSVRTDKWV